MAPRLTEAHVFSFSNPTISRRIWEKHSTQTGKIKNVKKIIKKTQQKKTAVTVKMKTIIQFQNSTVRSLLLFCPAI